MEQNTIGFDWTQGEFIGLDDAIRAHLQTAHPFVSVPTEIERAAIPGYLDGPPRPPAVRRHRRGSPASLTRQRAVETRRGRLAPFFTAVFANLELASLA